MRPLTIDDYLDIAELVSGIERRILCNVTHIGLVESALLAPYAGFGDYDKYPGLILKAAVLCSRLSRNHAMPDYNKRIAYVAMIRFLEQNGYRWTTPPAAEADHVLRRVAAGDLPEDELADWIERYAD